MQTIMAIYDFIKNMRSYVTMTCYGRVRSMGTVILQACDRRILMPNCMFMIHYGGAGNEGTAKDFLEFSKEIGRTNTDMENIYLNKIREKQPKYTRRKLRTLMRYDKYLLPKEAVELGLADG